MNTTRLLYILGDIDDEFIEQAETPKKKIPRIKWAAIAACIVLMAAVSGGVYYQSHCADNLYVATQIAMYTASYGLTDDQDQSSAFVPPTENEPCRSVDETAIRYQTHCYSYAEMAQKADLIICADVTKAYRKLKDTHFHCYAKLTVRTVLKGDLDPGEQIFYTDNGVGRRDANGNWMGGTTLCGGPLIETGNRVILFMKDQSDLFTLADGTPTYSYAFADMGKLFLDTDGKYHASVTYSDRYQQQEGYTASQMPEYYAPKTLEEIKALIDR